MHYSERYKFLKDENIFYDVQTRKSLTEPAIIKKLISLGIDLGKVQNIIEAIKLTPIFRASLDARRGPHVAINAAYEALRDKLPFKIVLSKNSTLLYLVKPNNEVVLTGVADKDAFSAHITHNRPIYNAMHEVYENSEVSSKLDKMTFYEAMFKRLILDPDRTLEHEPSLISWDPATPAFRVLDPSILNPGPTPNWDSFLSRIDYPEIFKAYIWSVFEPKNKGRQVLWIRGEGQDGKSTVVNAIANFLGHDHTFSMSLKTLNNDFFTGMAFGKRLAVYMDCKNLQLLRSSEIKSIVSGDTVDINIKHQQQFSAKIHCRLIVLSNYSPSITYNDASERSRLLFLTVKSFEGRELGDPNFEPNLIAEMGHFLYKCREAYAALCPNHGEMIVPPEMDASIKINCSGLDADIIEQFIEEMLEFGSGKEIKKTDLSKALKAYQIHNYAGGNIPFSFESLIRQLMQSHGVTESTIDIGGLKFKGYEGVRIRNTAQKVIDEKLKLV